LYVKEIIDRKVQSAMSMFVVWFELEFIPVSKEYHLKESMSARNHERSLTGSYK